MSAVSTTAPPLRAERSPRLRLLPQFGVLATFAACFALFAILKPHAFLTGGNMAGIANTAAVDAILAVGVTVPLIMRDFDLSIGSSASLGGALAVVLMSTYGWPVLGALAVVLAGAVLIGVANGIVVAYLGGSSFIATLAMGSVLTGIEFLLTDQQTIVGNVPAGFTDLGGIVGAQLIVPVFAAAVIMVVVGVALTQTPLGRYVHAIGSNPDAARVVGLKIAPLRMLGFICAAVCAAVAGVFISAISGNSFPSAGASHLLPAFAAAFLGGTLFPSRRFSAVGAGLSAWLLQMIATGLVQLDLDSWTINVFNGVVLIAAILTARKTVARG